MAFTLKTEYGRNSRTTLGRSRNGYPPYHVSPPIFQAELKQNLDARKQQVVVDIPVQGDHDSAARLCSQVSYISLTIVYYIHGLECLTLTFTAVLQSLCLMGVGEFAHRICG
jgi:hypothetical protein